MLLHAPRKIANAEAIPRFAAARALCEPTIFSPKRNPQAAFSRRRIRKQFLNQFCNQAQKPCRSNDVLKLYPPHQGFKFRLLDRISATPYPGATFGTLMARLPRT